MVDRIVVRGAVAAVVLAALVAWLTLLAPIALADAGAGASCMGHEASGISPPGSSDEFAGGMPEFNQFIRDNFQGTPPGAIIRTIAQQHGVSHEACD
jgi:hypothetical protein